MRLRCRRAVDLRLEGPRARPEVGPEHCISEGAHLRPAHQQLALAGDEHADVPEEDAALDHRVPADVRVRQGDPRDPPAQGGEKGAVQAVIPVPSHKLVAGPEQTAVLRRARRYGAGEEDYVVLPVLPREGQGVQLRPLLGEPVVKVLGVHLTLMISAADDRVEGQVFPEIRHPTARVGILEHVLPQDLRCVPLSRLGVRKVDRAEREGPRAAALDVRLARGIAD
mmetsp:Transcript_1979/g.4521  ORF Transcript_1979/g.4521 Transcript_1979/m.4521 type:complete len:225 (-) Transcript_1979:1391-2065(-)